VSLLVRLQPMFDWLVDGADGAGTSTALVGQLGHRLREAGIGVERITAFVRTLHPQRAGARFSWDPSLAEARAGDLPWGDLNTPAFLAGPLAQVFATGNEYRQRLDTPTPHAYRGFEEMRQAGLTDYVALSLKFLGGTTNGITYACATPGGFTDEQLQGLRWITRPLARVAETLSLMRTAVNLLNTYVGRNAGERILGGHIQRGDTESIRCVIWFSDLRGFTSLSGDKTPVETIAVLNELFECQVPAIEQHGGEVLKFIGDGMLAIFAITSRVDEHAAAEAAASASVEAFAALERLNMTRLNRGAAEIRFGLSLHVGDVAYGNIGGANRLDFTAIGSAVNLASRIESLTAKLGKNVLLSEELARLLRRPTRRVGAFELKGFTEPHAIFELA
jgi:adenylate cyclase